MKSRNTLFVIATLPFLLGACGQTGPLVMPKTYPTKPPPPPKESKWKRQTPKTEQDAPPNDIEKATQQETSPDNTEKTDRKD